MRTKRLIPKRVSGGFSPLLSGRQPSVLSPTGFVLLANATDNILLANTTDKFIRG